MMDIETPKRRSNFMLRLPHDLAMDIRTLAYERGISANLMATCLLRYGLRANQDKLTLAERLAKLGVR